MTLPRVEDVFTVSGVPTYTFVQPREYSKLIVGLRTRGRPVVVEGPSGIGKTSAIETALRDIGITRNVEKLSARKKADVEYIRELPRLGKIGTVIVDDFHKLDDSTRAELADYLKTIADESNPDVKIIVVGINEAGQGLINFAPDLANRVEILPFESNPIHSVKELIRKGEEALNIQLNISDEIAEAAQGSFYVAQLLCIEVCTRQQILHKCDPSRKTAESFESVRSDVWERIGRAYAEPCRLFCRGTRMKPDGRAPYLTMLKLLAEGESWSLSLRDLVRKYPEHKSSIGQVVDKGFLTQLLDSKKELQKLLHYDSSGKSLTVEDPQFVFYLKNMPWARLARDLGFSAITFERRYDFALSFAGADRSIAETLFDALQDEEVATFYDKNEQHRILAEDVEEYLRPVYQSEAQFIVPLLSAEYPKRIWTKFESDNFKQRFREGAVIPVWFSDAPPGMFDQSRSVGGITFDRAGDLRKQVDEIAKLLVGKLRAHREARPAI